MVSLEKLFCKQYITKEIFLQTVSFDWSVFLCVRWMNTLCSCLVHLFPYLHWAALLVTLLLRSFLQEPSCPALMLWLSYDNETKVLWTIDWMLKLQEEEMVWLGPPHTPFTCLEIAASFLSAQSCEPKKPPNIQITSQPEFYYTVARNLMYCIFPKPSS